MKFFFLLVFLFIKVSPLLSADYIDKGFYIIDLKNKVEWLKCSAGQQWSDKEENALGMQSNLTKMK